ncbi:EcsC family protein [Acinetobacter terrestris]|uniref:EcsC family protein n=1 Tax=Acinetobacter terrestris TaxID=2529843 RepID=A0AAW6UT50_9GAMM|nr:EcsC family protein [Acinetobacter terrestris]MDK1685014.1 EcsC family protein [Acinetobacter terrestris]
MIKQTEYEKNALNEIYIWKTPKEKNFLQKSFSLVTTPINKAAEVIIDSPYLGEVITKSISGLTTICNESAQTSVRPQAIFDDISSRSPLPVRKLDDIQKVDLVILDKSSSGLRRKYIAIATTEGAGTGAVGLPGIIVDIPSLILINFRAIGEYATYYGFDIELPEEKIFILNILSLASAPTDQAKHVAMAQLAKIATQVAKKTSWRELEKLVLVNMIKRMAEALGIRLTKAKLAQAVPIFGAFVGAGFNAYYTEKVCDAAYFLYKERFLARKYDLEIK